MMVAVKVFGQDMPMISMGGMINMLKAPIAVGEVLQAPCAEVGSTVENMPTNGCRALQVSTIIFDDPTTGKVRGTMGGYVYSSMKESAFAVTNQIRNAVGEVNRNSAMVVPYRNMKTYGEELYWWKPSPDAKGSLELIVRAYKNKSGQVFIGTCLHTKGDDIGVKFVQPGQ